MAAMDGATRNAGQLIKEGDLVLQQDSPDSDY
jgi:F0F1-type ATP synthase gamma subunit